MGIKSDIVGPVSRSEVIWKQVGDHIRGKIMRGELAPGTRLPPTVVLAAEAGTDVKTLHRALTVLAKEGLISRKRKIGTFVAERQHSIAPIGIYTAMGVPFRATDIFVQHLALEIQQEASRRKMPTLMWNDPRSEEEYEQPLPSLVHAIRNKQINSLICINSNRSCQGWIEKLHMPVSYMGGTLPTAVKFDYVDFYAKSIAALKKKGCRSIAVIANLDHRLTAEFLRLCRENKVTTREEYLIYRTPGSSVDLEEFGYEAFRKLWALSPLHPEGVIVFPDLTSRGVIVAAAESGARIGDELHIAMHRNEGIEIFCPFPATYIVSSVRDFAKGLIMQVESLMAGKETRTFELKHRLEFGGVGK